MKHLDKKLTSALERWGEAHTPLLWRFGAEYALFWFVLEAIGFIFVMPLATWLLGLCAVIVVHVATLGIQLVVRRERPVHHRTQPYKLWIHTYSFPSAHSSAAFACAVMGSSAAMIYAPQFALVLLVVNIAAALLIAMSRVLVGVHFASDVIAGSVLGVVLGMLFAGVLLG